MSDTLRRPGKYIFPPGTSIPPNGYLVVWCDNETNAPGLHSGFALDNDGQTVALFTLRANGFALADSVAFGLQIPNKAIGRAIDGTGTWGLVEPTPGAPVVDAVTDSVVGLKINEWMASDANGPDWIELYNSSSLPVELSGLGLTDNRALPAKSIIPPLSFIMAGGFRQFIADEDPGASARHLDFRLGSSGESLGLYDTRRVLIDAIDFGPQLASVSEGRLPDGSDTIVAFPTTSSPDESNYLPVENVVINEVLAHSDPPLQDTIELFNPTGAPADLSGWWLSDDRNRPQKFRLPADVILPAGEFLVIFESEFNPTPGDPSSFALSSARGDDLYLSAALEDGTLTGYRTGVKFAASESGVSLGWFATSLGNEFVALSQRTFDADNAPAKVGPVVVSEIQYHPADLPGGADNDRDEFIELRNITAASVPLFHPAAPTNTWRLRDAVDFTFPSSITLLPNETILVVGFDPVADTNALAGFRETHGPSTARLFGPWTGKLDNSQDSVELVKSDAPVTVPGPDFGYVPTIVVDRVHYEDGFPWPDGADGSGFSIMRDPLTGYGNEPLNWFAWFGTPGRNNAYNEPPTIAITTPANGAVILGPADILVSANVSDPDGSVAQVDFYDGTNRLARLTQPPFTLLWRGATFGRHTLTATARDNGYAASVSAPVDVLVSSQPPVVTLTSPTNGAIFIASNLVNLIVTATDPDSAIVRVEFRVDGVKIAEDLTPPYSASWIAVPGYHELIAIATDAGDTSGTSTPGNIFVQTVSSSEQIAVSTGSSWRYFDGGVYPGLNWPSLAFNDASWGTGLAEFGFGDGGEATVLRSSIQGSASIAFYFRQRFNVTSVANISSVRLNMLRDDGAVAYLNGVEVARDNMPAGTVTNTTLASVAISVPEENTFYPYTINPARLVVGANILSVEVHQASATSSDVSFDANLRITRFALGPAITRAPVSQQVAPGEDVTFTATATGSAPLTYQWNYNGVPLPGETASTLFLSGVQPANSGAYSITVANSVTSVTSPSAELIVSQSALKIGGIELMPNGQVKLTISVAANLQYVLQYTDSFGAPWFDVETIPVQPVTRTVELIYPPEGAQGFFRLSLIREN